METTTSTKPYYLLVIVLAFCGTGYAQGYEANPCKGAAPGLKVLLKGEFLQWTFVDHNCGSGGWLSALCTSMLSPDGIAPKKPDYSKLTYDEKADASQAYDLQNDSWTCMYASSNLTDRNTTTAWVEGVAGPGIGEFAIVPGVDVSQKVKIWNGLGKSDALYHQNNRLKKINVHIFRTAQIDAAQCGNIYKGLSKVATRRIELKDFNGYQDLPLPTFKIEKFKSERFGGQEVEYQYMVGVEIVEVYAGTKYQDTCISEISN